MFFYRGSYRRRVPHRGGRKPSGEGRAQAQRVGVVEHNPVERRIERLHGGASLILHRPEQLACPEGSPAVLRQYQNPAPPPSRSARRRSPAAPPHSAPAQIPRKAAPAAVKGMRHGVGTQTGACPHGQAPCFAGQFYSTDSRRSLSGARVSRCLISLLYGCAKNTTVMMSDAVPKSGTRTTRRRG